MHGRGIVTGFRLDPAAAGVGREAYWRLRHRDQVRGALVPTVDEGFLVHALDGHRAVEVQADLFTEAHPPPTVPPGVELRTATADDVRPSRRARTRCSTRSASTSPWATSTW